MRTIDLFLKGRSEKELRTRDKILHVIQIFLWVAAAIATLNVVCHYRFYLGAPGFLGWTLMVIFLPLAIRFEFWVMHYFSREYHAGGQDWVRNGIKDNPVFQKKFFTGENHKEGDRNPLW